MGRAAYSDEQLSLICLASIEGVGPRTIRRLMRAARSGPTPLADLLGMPAPALVAELGVYAHVAPLVSAVRSPAEAAEQTLEELRALEARPVFEGEEDYPPSLARHLGELAPPVLFLLGDAEVLRRPTVGIAGSRTPSPLAEDAARGFASGEAAAGLAVVSGGAAGIDTVAHHAALWSGATVLVPPLGLARFEFAAALGEGLPQGRWCAVGQFPLRCGWNNAHALIRNRTIVALSDAVVGFDPRDHGGTWHSCRTALQMGKPLFVVCGKAEAPNRRALERLVRLGAQALDPGRMPEAGEFQQLVESYEPPPRPRQWRLFGAQQDEGTPGDADATR